MLPVSEKKIPPIDFFAAAQSNDHETLGSYLTGEYEVNAHLGFGSNNVTALLAASISGHAEIVQELIRHGADVNKMSHAWGAVPLHSTIRAGHLDITQILVENGADLNKADKSGITPLIFASELGLTDIVDYLIRTGAHKDRQTGYEMVTYTVRKLINMHGISRTTIQELEEPYAGNTALMKACWNGHSAVVKKLLQSGCNYRLTNGRGNTALHIACKTGKLDIVKLFLNYVNVLDILNDDGMSPLFTALETMFVGRVTTDSDESAASQVEKQFQIAKVLIQAGSEVSFINSKGQTIFDILCSQPTFQMQELDTYRTILFALVIAAVSTMLPVQLTLDHRLQFINDQHQECMSWLLKVARCPRSLQHLAKVVVRKNLGENLWKNFNVNDILHLPTILCDFIYLNKIV